MRTYAVSVSVITALILCSCAHAARTTVAAKTQAFPIAEIPTSTDEGQIQPSQSVTGMLNGQLVAIAPVHGGAAGHVHVANVYGLRNGHPVLLTEITPAGNGSIGSIRIDKGQVVVTEYAYAQGDGDCCPSLKTIHRYDGSAILGGNSAMPAAPVGVTTAPATAPEATPKPNEANGDISTNLAVGTPIPVAMPSPQGPISSALSNQDADAALRADPKFRGEGTIWEAFPVYGATNDCSHFSLPSWITNANLAVLGPTKYSLPCRVSFTSAGAALANAEHWMSLSKRGQMKVAAYPAATCRYEGVRAVEETGDINHVIAHYTLARQPYTGRSLDGGTNQGKNAVLDPAADFTIRLAKFSSGWRITPSTDSSYDYFLGCPADDIQVQRLGVQLAGWTGDQF